MSTEILSTRLGKDDVRGIYSKIAGLYDFWAGPTERRARDLAISLAAIRDGEAVLEVAVGTGFGFAEILKRNPSGRNEGVDLTPAMLEKARIKAAKVGGNFNLAIGDAYALPFADASFDLVMNSYMFDLLPEQDFPLVLAEFHRVLKPGGRLILTNMTKAKRWWQGAAEAVYRLNPSWMAGCRGVVLEPYVARVGFGSISRDFLTQCTFPSEVIRAVKV